MKRARSPSHPVADIERRILDLLRTNRRLLFTERAKAMRSGFGPKVKQKACASGPSDRAKPRRPSRRR
jgi:hypothetical protein